MNAVAGRMLLLTEDLYGAPVRVGATVEIASRSIDDTFDLRYLGQTGVVTGLLYDDPPAQLPGSPLVVVLVPGLGEDLFFADELVVRAPPLPAFRH